MSEASSAEASSGEQPGAARAGEDPVARIGARAQLHDLYSEVGAPVYQAAAGADPGELPEMLRATRRVEGPILDLAAGAGRLTLPLLAAGHEVTALELSPSMIAMLADAVARTPERLRTRCTMVEGDMSAFDLPTRFGAVVLGGTSVTLLDAPGRAALYDAVGRHLVAGGPFLVSTLTIDGDEDEAIELVSEIPTSLGVYTIVEQRPPQARQRTVTFLPADLDGDEAVPVLTSQPYLLSPEGLASELAAAGFVVDREYPLPMEAPRRAALLEARKP